MDHVCTFYYAKNETPLVNCDVNVIIDTSFAMKSAIRDLLDIIRTQFIYL